MPVTNKCLNCRTKTISKHSTRFCSRSCSASYVQRGAAPRNKTGKNGSEKLPKRKCVDCYCILSRRRKTDRCQKCNRILLQSKSTASIDSPKPYKGYRLYRPRMENTGRWSVHLFSTKTGKRFTLSLARYIMSIGLGRRLPGNMHVDHIDNNSQNDVWTNLQVLTAHDNLLKGSTSGIVKRKMILFTCPVCFERTLKRDTKGPKSQASVLCCSRKCSYKFNSLSKHYRDRKVVANAQNINSISRTIQNVRLYKEEPVGERIPFKTKGMRRVHNFFMRKGVRIL